MRDTRRHRLSIRSEEEYYLNIFRGLGAKMEKCTSNEWFSSRAHLSLIDESTPRCCSMASKGDNQIAFRLFWIKMNPENCECLKYRCKISDIERTKNKSGYTNLSSQTKSTRVSVRLSRGPSLNRGSKDRWTNS